MTGYQKLKRENEILWREITNQLRIEALSVYGKDEEKIQLWIKKEIAWIKETIREATHEEE